MEKEFILLPIPKSILDNFNQTWCGALEFFNLSTGTDTKGSLPIMFAVGRENICLSNPINKEYYFLRESIEMILKMVLDEFSIQTMKWKVFGKTVFMSFISLVKYDKLNFSFSMLISANCQTNAYIGQ